jgi:hypothetical protein
MVAWIADKRGSSLIRIPLADRRSKYSAARIPTLTRGFMTFTPAFYRSAAICSFVSAVTTSLLIFLPFFFVPVDTFEGRMDRVYEPAYLLRSWAYLVHPFLVLMAAMAIAMRIRRIAPAAALIGLTGFVLWAFNEALQQSVTLYAFDKWRLAYVAADETVRGQIRTNTMMYDGLWDAMYFLLLIGFTIGNTCLGVALLRKSGLSRIVGVFLFAASALTLALIFRELHWPTLPEPVMTWSYPAIQPAGRLLIGLWLWRAADESIPLR